MKTMIVDDRITIVNMMKLLLERIDPSGEHTGFTDPREAIGAAKRTVFDVAFLDIEMPDMNGIDLAKRLQNDNPLINIIFITGYDEYMPKAFELYASGYIMKPITEQALRGALGHLRYKPQNGSGKPVKVRCFGSFEVYVNDKPVRFPRAKCKEFFAYLIDRQGSICTKDMVIGSLWQNEPADAARKSMARNALSEMIGTFRSLGIEDLIIREKNGVAVNAGMVDCDYFRWLDGDPYALHKFLGEYMSQYEFAEETRYNLQMKGHRSI